MWLCGRRNEPGSIAHRFTNWDRHPRKWRFSRFQINSCSALPLPGLQHIKISGTADLWRTVPLWHCWVRAARSDKPISSAKSDQVRDEAFKMGLIKYGSLRLRVFWSAYSKRNAAYYPGENQGYFRYWLLIWFWYTVRKCSGFYLCWQLSITVSQYFID